MTKLSPYGNSISHFEVLNKIGSGGFAEVFKAKCLRPGLENTYVAIKKINKKHVDERRCRDKIKNEIHIHSTLPSHPSFVKLYTSFEDSKYWYLVLELCAGGSFEEYIKKRHRISEAEAAQLIKQVIIGVQCLHFNLIIHRDLSLRNLLFTENNLVKIADFGLALKLNHHDEKTNTVLGTANFMSPEVVSHDAYDFKADCWSVGCVLYALLYGSPPFNDKKREYIMESVKYSQLMFPDYATSEAKELLMAMLSKDPEERISLTDALKYAFFQKYEKSETKLQINYEKSGDSGLSSLSCSGSRKSRSTRKSSKDSQKNSNYMKQKENKNRLVHSSPPARCHEVTHFDDRCSSFVPDEQRPEYSLSKLKANENGPSFVNHMKTRIQAFPPRYESQVDTPIKSHPPCLSYPSELHHFAKRNLNSHMYFSDCCSTYENVPRVQNNSNVHSYKYTSNNCIITKSVQDNIQKDPSCSHEQYCSSNVNCCHKLNCGCRRIKNDFCPSVRIVSSNSQHHEISPAFEKCLKDIVAPLNTIRITSRRKEIEGKDVVISILNNGQVSLEFLKLKRSKKYVYLVYYIAEDGFEITVFRPKKKIPLSSDKPPPLSQNEEEILYFTFDNLPKAHWKKYQFAKYFVDKVRGITPKVIIHGEHAACIMMENAPNPNYEINFYNGYQITEVGNKRTIKDENGYSVSKTDNSIHFMLKVFDEMKEKCVMLEKNIEAYHEANFPVTLGKKPSANKRNAGRDAHNKENLTPSHMSSPSINGLTSCMKSCDITIEKSPYRNSFQRNTSTPNSVARSASSSRIVSAILPQLKKLEVKNAWIVIEYSDGVQMHISKQDESIFFYDTRSQTRLPRVQYPHLMQRFDTDLQNTLKFVKNT